MISVLVSCLLTGCGDIFETDINQDEVTVIAPADSVVVAGNELAFMWEMLNGASHYHLQLAEPSFEKAQKVLIDTLLTENSFTTTVDFGQYEWRLRAQNSEYATPYHYAKVWVDSSDNIEDFRVALLSPSDNFESQATEHTFSWKPLALADYYIFQLEGSDTTIFQQVKETSLKVSFKTKDDSFSWKVLGMKDETGRSTPSATWKLRIDNTPPEAAKLELPADKAVLPAANQINFKWKAVEEEDLKGYILHIYKEDNPSDPIFKKELKETQIDLYGKDDALIPGQYLWEVQTVDRLGNMSTLGSLTRSFQVQ